MQFLFILTGLSLLIAACIRLVLDGLIAYETAVIGFETLRQSWENYFPAGLKLIEAYMPNMLLDPYLTWILGQPSFAILGVAGVAFIILSYMFRRRNKRKLADDFI